MFGSRIGTLRERESELEALSDALSEAAGGRAQLVRIEGPGGIGKSRLLAAACHRVPTRIGLLSAVAAELERSFARLQQPVYQAPDQGDTGRRMA